MKHRNLATLATIVSTNRPKLIAAAQRYLEQWHNLRRKDVVYYLVDQTYLDTLLQEVLHFTDDETQAIGESDINCVGEVDIWIEASKKLGFDDYVKSLEQFKVDGP